LSSNSTNTAAAKSWIALFDLDGTLTWRDTLLPFLLGFLRRRPHRAFGLWRLPLALARYWQVRDRGALKSSVIQMLMRGEKRSVLDAWAQIFVAELKAKNRFRPLALAVVEAHRAAGDLLDWRDLFLRERCRIFEARIDIGTINLRISLKEALNGIAVGQHADYLMHRKTRALYASLSVANAWVN